MVKAIIDMYNLKESQRIFQIGNTIMQSKEPMTVGVIVDDDAKADRYIRHMAERFPKVRMVEKIQGPATLVTIRFGTPE